MSEPIHPTTDQHTPGPWHQFPSNPLVIESEKHGNIALVNLARASEADARLIAAAPDLLSALKDLAACCGDDDDKALLAAMRAAVVAINKAEDRS